MKDAIVLKPFVSPTLTISIDAEKTKKELLERAKDFKIFDAEDQERCVELMKEIKVITKSVDSARKTLKQPYSDFAKKIEDTAKSYTGSLEDALDVLGKTLTEFQVEEQKRQLEEQKKIAEAQAKLEIEAQKKIAAAKTDEKVVEIAEKVEQKSAELQVRYQQATAPRTSGMIGRNVPVYEILDIKKFYEVHPELVKLVEEKALINAAIKDGKVKPIAGVFTCEMKQEFGVSTR